MPWSDKQRVAIFLNVKRRKGLAAARALMHKHGYGAADRSARREALRRRR
jgi:hypothetical protein